MDQPKTMFLWGALTLTSIVLAYYQQVTLLAILWGVVLGGSLLAILAMYLIYGRPVGTSDVTSPSTNEVPPSEMMPEDWDVYFGRPLPEPRKEPEDPTV